MTDIIILLLLFTCVVGSIILIWEKNRRGSKCNCCSQGGVCANTCADKKRANDKLLISIVVTIALFALLVVKIFFDKTGNELVISIAGKEYGKYDLYSSQVIEIDNQYGKNTIEISYGKVQVASADCPDQICVNHAPITGINETIVCLPHKLVVEVISNDRTNNEIDAVAK